MVKYETRCRLDFDRIANFIYKFTWTLANNLGVCSLRHLMPGYIQLK
jgi:hypothetical protein